MTAKARQLVPDPVPLALIRCEAEMKYSWKQLHEPNADTQCCNRANYEIEGKSYCKKHAGLVALQVLLEQSE